MATTRKSTKPAVEEVENDEVEETVTAEPTIKQTINAGIARVADELGVDAKNRYKVQRALFFIAARTAIEDGTFDDLLEALITDVSDLPSGFELERTVSEKAPAKKAAAKPAAAKAAPAKAAPRKRPAR